MDRSTFSRELISFVKESNRIEGITRPPTDEELTAHLVFLNGPKTVQALKAFVSAIQPGAVLRDQKGLNVRVGTHVPIAGGPLVLSQLTALLDDDRKYITPFRRHCHYETLHPFTDGNGRSGRALWLKDMGGLDRVKLGFLHSWYYQTLIESDDREAPAFQTSSLSFLLGTDGKIG